MLQVCSDLHLERNDITESDFEKILKPSSEILALAGDIGDPYSDIFEKFIVYCSKHFKYVLFVSGNHEYYYHTITEVDQCIERLFGYFTNVIYLNNRIFEYDGITFVGSTLWSEILNNPDNDVEMWDLFQVCDYTLIKDFTPMYCDRLYKKNVEFICDKLEHKSCIIISHHAPTYKCISEEYLGSKLNCVFASQLDNLLEHPNLVGWVYGHTHYNYIRYKQHNFLYANGYRTDDYNSSGVAI
jgi:predicted phosphohydrolase